MPIFSAQRQAAVMASPKTAALYYQRIYPMPARREHLVETEELLSLPNATLQSVLIESDIEDIRSLLSSISENYPKYGPDQGEFANNGFVWNSRLEQAIYAAAMACHVCEDKELLLAQMPVVSAAETCEAQPSDSALVKMVNLNLVDTSTATWPQIIEFRSDTDAIAAFSRLRDFLFTSCSTMSLPEVQDILASLMEDYELISSEHGFQTQQASLDVLLSSEAFINMASTGLLLPLLQNAELAPWSVAGTSFITGSAIVMDCARAAITQYGALKERKRALKQHPASWVFLAQNALGVPADNPVEILTAAA